MDGFRVHRCALAAYDLVAVLIAYFDESYNQPNAKRPNDPLVYTVAAYLAPVAQWRKFSRKWHSALRQIGIESFHMNKYENRIGEYADWPEIKRVGVIKRLQRIIKEHTIYSCSFSMDKVAFDEEISPELRRAVYARSPYGFNAFSCMSELSAWCEEHGFKEPINYVFAHLQKQGGDLDSFFNQALRDAKIKAALRLTGTWTKGLAKDVPQLQAADILAYEINKRIVDVVAGGDRAIRKSLQNMRLVSGNRFHGGFFSREQMIQMESDFRAGKLKGATMITSI